MPQSPRTPSMPESTRAPSEDWRLGLRLTERLDAIGETARPMPGVLRRPRASAQGRHAGSALCVFLRMPQGSGFRRAPAGAIPGARAPMYRYRRQLAASESEPAHPDRRIRGEVDFSFLSQQACWRFDLGRSLGRRPWPRASDARAELREWSAARLQAAADGHGARLLRVGRVAERSRARPGAEAGPNARRGS